MVLCTKNATFGNGIVEIGALNEVPRLRIGELLLKAELISEEELDQALLMQQRAPGERIGALLIKRGAISEDAFLPVLAEQLGLRLLEPAALLEYKEAVRTTMAGARVALRWGRQHMVAVWRSDDDVLYVAAKDPIKSSIREIVRAQFPTVGRFAWQLCRSRDLERLFDELERSEGARSVNLNEIHHLKELAEEAPIVELVNSLFARATDARASDIHVEPEEFGFTVRARVDGVLKEIEAYSRERFDAVVSRIKLIAELDIAERRLPQDGRFTIRAGGIESDVRVSVIPSVWGESIVMRLLPKERGGDFSLDALGMESDHRAIFEHWISEPHGIVLVTGPTGSGKSTSLYTALTLANDRTNKIITVEDPVEFHLEGVTQIQVQPEIGYTFASALRAILRHDPDIVMIGEIRDLETAQIAVQASLTGHMVFSTLHTNDALSAFNRLIDMGVEPFLVASSLRGVLAQRLVRRLCPVCSERGDATPEQAALLDRVLSVEQRALLGDPNVRRPVGCDNCLGSGFRGRIGIYEFLPVSDSMRAAIAARSVTLDALTEGERARWRTLSGDGLIKVWRGVTTFAEVMRVAGSEGA